MVQPAPGKGERVFAIVLASVLVAVLILYLIFAPVRGVIRAIRGRQSARAALRNAADHRQVHAGRFVREANNGASRVGEVGGLLHGAAAQSAVAGTQRAGSAADEDGHC